MAIEEVQDAPWDAPLTPIYGVPMEEDDEQEAHEEDSRDGYFHSQAFGPNKWAIDTTTINMMTDNVHEAFYAYNDNNKINLIAQKKYHKILLFKWKFILCDYTSIPFLQWHIELEIYKALIHAACLFPRFKPFPIFCFDRTMNGYNAYLA
ncbi:hypothetical protein ACJX0J_019503, partial [Zea mays]